MTIVKGNVKADHVHLLVEIPADISVSDLMQAIKGKAARLLFQEYPTLRRRYWGQHLWARGYFAASVGQVDEALIKEYIEHQENHMRWQDQLCPYLGVPDRPDPDTGQFQHQYLQSAGDSLYVPFGVFACPAQGNQPLALNDAKRRHYGMNYWLQDSDGLKPFQKSRNPAMRLLVSDIYKHPDLTTDSAGNRYEPTALAIRHISGHSTSASTYATSATGIGWRHPRGGMANNMLFLAGNASSLRMHQIPLSHTTINPTATAPAGALFWGGGAEDR